MTFKANLPNLNFEIPGIEVEDIYSRLNRPELGRMLRILKLDLVYHRASGNYLFAKINGEEKAILDCLGGYGSTILGHNHPRIKDTILNLIQGDTPVHAQASLRSGSARLALKLNEMLKARFPKTTGDYVCTFLSTGTEATEAALKHSLMAWSDKRHDLILKLERVQNSLLQNRKTHPEADRIETFLNQLKRATPCVVALEGSFHGKTAGSLCTTYSAKYKGMYPARAVETIYVAKDSSQQNLQNIFETNSLQMDGLSLNLIAGVFVEMIQGEGGIQVLNRDFAQNLDKLCKSAQVPLIVDEIQTGLFRTGRFLACEKFEIQPDYLLLGKSLGGGMMKISAFIARSDLYVNEFGMLHTSTFCEDDLSSLTALETLEELSCQELASAAVLFESQLRMCVKNIQAMYPQVIKEIRGTGWMLGLEFHLDPDQRAPVILDSINQTGYSTYVFASYLLHRHQIRVAATLSQSNTIRLEPSYLINPTEIQKLCEALTDLCRHLYDGKLGVVFSKVLGLDNTEEPLILDRLSPRKPEPMIKTDKIKKVVFLSHFITTESVRNLDPIFKNLTERNLKYFMKDVGPIGSSIAYYQQMIQGKNGGQVLLEMRGLTVGTDFFEASLRQKNHLGYMKVQEAVSAAVESGADYVGLGQFTSIASDNGMAFRNLQGVTVTTGNSLTVGIAYRELLRCLAQERKQLKDCRVGIVGAAGNICNVYAQLVGDEAHSMVLIHREPLAESPKFQNAIENLLKNSKIKQEQILASTDLNLLNDCDIVISGTNSTQQMLMPEHFQDHAIVLDVAVPSNVYPSILSNNRGIQYIQGGYVQLPLGQKMSLPIMPAPHGQIFACMAETVTLGLLGYPKHFSMGALSKGQIFEVLAMADIVGMELGIQKTNRGF